MRNTTPHIAVIGAGITGVTTAYALGRKRLCRHRVRSAALCRDGNVLRQWRPAFRQQRRGLEPLVHGHQGHHLDAEERRAAADEPVAELAQVFLDGRVRRQHSQVPLQHHRDHPARHRGAQAPVRHGGAGRHRLRPGNARHPALLPRQEGLRPCRPRQRDAGGRRAGPACRDGGRDPRDRAGPDGRLPRRFLHAVGCHRRHPQVHPRAGEGLHPARRPLRP